MKANFKEKVLLWIEDIEVDESMYLKIKAMVVDYHVRGQNQDNPILNLYEAIDLNDDVEYEKHLARSKEIRDAIFNRKPTEAEELRDDIKSAEQIVIETRKSQDFVQKLQTHDGIGDAVVYIQNGVEIKREYPWGTDAENTVVEIKSTNREVYVKDEA